MKKKNIALIAAGALAAGTAGWALYDKYECQSINLNTAYCAVRNAIFGTDGEADVDIALYYDDSLSRSQMRNARDAFETASEEYKEKFNIEFNVVSERYARASGTSIVNNADLSIVFVSEIPDDDKTDTKEVAGLANRRTNIITIEYSQFDECLESAILHEIGHMFYADHSDNPLCVMYHHQICFRMDEWCEDEKAVITEYKHRFW